MRSGTVLSAVMQRDGVPVLKRSSGRTADTHADRIPTFICRQFRGRKRFSGHRTSGSIPGILPKRKVQSESPLISVLTTAATPLSADRKLQVQRRPGTRSFFLSESFGMCHRSCDPTRGPSLLINALKDKSSLLNQSG